MSLYQPIDQPTLLKYLFYPRTYCKTAPENAYDLFVTVEEGVSIAVRFYVGVWDWPWILFFHGNGEVASDYDEIAPLYYQKGINLIVAGYRGYGASEGVPTFSSMINDAHYIFRAVEEEIKKKEYQHELWIMGRSLGSISALELASKYSRSFEGIIVESGFLCVSRLIEHLGLPCSYKDLGELESECIEKAKKITIPALIIHGEFDSLIPVWLAEELYHSLGSSIKKMAVIPNADHNNLMFAGMEQYFKSIQQFIYNAVR